MTSETDLTRQTSALLERWRKSPTFRPNIKPIPLIPEKTMMIRAGVIDIGVEDRRLTTEIADSHRASMGMSKTEDLLEDEGPSVHVLDAQTGFEHLRFDLFPKQPHYHYLVPGLDGVPIILFDVAANGNMIDWVCDTLANRLGPMLDEAGFSRTDLLDEHAIADAVSEVRRLLDEPQRRVFADES